MKPTKNHYYCVACHRPKMLFETQAKANNFIRYNAAEMLQAGTKAPVRSYYCSLCGGWHVTSNPSTEDGERLDQRDNELVKRLEARKTVRPITTEVKAQIDEITNIVNTKLQEYAFLGSTSRLPVSSSMNLLTSFGAKSSASVPNILRLRAS